LENSSYGIKTSYRKYSVDNNLISENEIIIWGSSMKEVYDKYKELENSGKS